MIRRFLLLSAFVLFSSMIEDTPRSLAANNDPASFVGDGIRAIASMRDGDTVADQQERFRQLFRQYFDVEACARLLSGHIGYRDRAAAAGVRRTLRRITSSSAIPPPFVPLGGASFEVLESHSDREGVIVSSRVQISGGAPIRIDWRLNPTNHGYKVTDVIVNGISTASKQHADLVSVIQRNNGHVQSLLIAMREKM